MDDNDLWIDPTLEEAQAAKGTLILSTMPALETVTSVWQNGRMQPADVLKVSSSLCSAYPSLPF